MIWPVLVPFARRVGPVSLAMPKSEDLDGLVAVVAPGDEEVLGLDVAVDDAEVLRAAERLRRLEEDREHLIEGIRPIR